jgi:hypothetical protein
MDDKRVAYEQLEEIHASLVDHEKFMPYDYRMLIGWGVVSAFLFLTFEAVTTRSIGFGLLYVASIIIIASLVETYLTKRVNVKYDLPKLTKLQRFVESVYCIATVLALMLSYILISHGLIVYTYISWVSLLGFSSYVTGFVMNHKRVMSVGAGMMASGVVLYVGSFMIDLGPYIKYLAAAVTGGGFIYMGITMKKECDLV